MKIGIVRFVTIARCKEKGRGFDCLRFSRWQSGVGGRWDRHTFSTVSGPVLVGGMVSVGSMECSRGLKWRAQTGGGLGSNTRNSGSGHTTLQWFCRKRDRAC